MKIVVTGATGLLGRAVMETLKEHDPLGIGFSRATHPIVKLDLTDSSALSDFLQKHRPEVVIHAAAERRPDVAEQNEEGTLQLNIESCRVIARLASKLYFKLIYISTDYVIAN
jgi:dTDP-4-dehydrorhamnose reductase